MCKAILAAVLFIVGIQVFAQNSNVTATVVDPDSQSWNNGSWQITFVPPTGYIGSAYTFNGSPWTPPAPISGLLTGSGAFNYTPLPRNDYILPAGSFWAFKFCPNASAGCSVTTILINQASQTITGNLVLVAPRFAASNYLNGSFGYNDGEISPSNPPIGNSYFNVTTNVIRCWAGSWLACGGGTPGAVGPPGPQGPPGATGATGATGPTGVPGNDGATGATGAQGATGPAGPQGPPGASGAAGAAGPQGPAGPTGSTGPQGAQGEQGNVGVQGVAGPTGATGATGSQGPTGPAGATGPVGITYRQTWSSATNYNQNDVVTFVGTSYIALSANNNLNPSANPGTWAVVALAGAQGASGPTGGQGPQGPPGNAWGLTATPGQILYYAGTVDVPDFGGYNVIPYVNLPTIQDYMAHYCDPSDLNGYIWQSNGTNWACGPNSGGGGGGSVLDQAAGVIPLATAPTVIGAQSALSDNGVNVTSSEPHEAPIYPTTYFMNLLYNSDTTGPQTFVSIDGIHVQPTTKAAGAKIFSTSVFRDPRVIKAGNTYFLSYTNVEFSSGNTIGLAYSNDLQNWTVATTPNWSAFLTGGANSIANGCWFYDSSSSTYYMYFAAYNNSGPVGIPYQVTFNPTTKSFGTPTAISLSPSRTYSWPMNVFKIGSTYYYLLQSQTSGVGYLELASSSSVTGALTIVGVGNWAGWNTTVASIESGTSFVNASGQYEVLFNTFAGGPVYYSLATPSGSPTSWSWSTPTAINSGGVSQTQVDWVDVIPTNDIQTDQALNALSRANSVVSSASGLPLLAPQIVLASPIASISITGIQQSYTNAKMVICGFTSNSSPDDVLLQFNGDTSADYDWSFQVGGVVTPSNGGHTNTTTTMHVASLNQSSLTLHGSCATIEFLSYSSSTLPKVSMSTWARYDTSEVGLFVGGFSGDWVSTNAINSITLTLASGANFTAGTTITLYGY